ncbi:unnamed protein product [Meloidogyne enterolobii]|uniref:Uncharacterized protein n=1 Tax=Meloidogyne enterolobii TaxID=390850 RepID=A0ACB1AXX5_MELEN
MLKSFKRFVFGNIPYNTTETDLGNMFSSCGVVTNVRIVIDRNTNRPKGFGFCEFQDQQGADDAVAKMNGTEMNGRPLRVSYANNK